MIYRIFYLILIGLPVFGQQRSAEILKARLTKDSLICELGSTFSNRLLIQNTTNHAIYTHIEFKHSKDLHPISSLPSRVQINAREIASIPVKFLVQSTATQRVVKVDVRITMEGDSLKQSTNTTSLIYLKNRNDYWQITTDQDQPQFTSESEGLKVPVRIKNPSFNTEQVKLDLASFPEGFEMDNRNHIISLSPRADTTIFVQCRANNRLNRNANYNLTLWLKDQKDQIMSTLLVRPVFLSHTRRYIHVDKMGLYPNMIQLSYARLGPAISTYESLVAGEEEIKNGRLRYAAHYLNYQPIQKHELRNTFIELQRNNFSTRIGNINEYHELAMIGRGIAVKQGFNKHRLNAWAYREGWNLVGPYSQDSLQSSVISVLSEGLVNGQGNMAYNASLNYIQGYKYHTGLAFGSFSFQPTPTHYFRLLLGANRTEVNNEQRYGGAAGLDYNYISRRLEFKNRLYFSTPTYAGFQKGSRNVDSWLVRKSNSPHRYALHAYTFQYKEKPLLPGRPVYEYGMTTLEGMYTWSAHRFFLTLKPYYLAQSLRDSTFNRSQSYRLSATTALQLNRVRVEGTYDAGFFEATAHERTYDLTYSQRAIFAFSSPYFNLYSLYQKGGYFITDLLMAPIKPEKFEMLSTTPSITLNFRKIRGYVGVNIFYLSPQDLWNAQVVGSLSTTIMRSWTIRAEAVSFTNEPTRVFQPETYTQGMQQYRFDLIKNLGSLTKSQHHQLRLRFFEDVNQNGKHDKDEPWMPNLFVKLKGSTLITDDEGTIVYKDIPSGSCEVQAYGSFQSGNPALFTETLQLTKNIRRDIPLQRIFQVSGVLRFPSKRYVVDKVDMTQYKLEARSGDGKSYAGYPDAEGKFNLYVPRGNYQIFVLDLTKPQAENVIQTMSYLVSNTAPTELLQIMLQQKQRSVEVRRLQSRL